MDDLDIVLRLSGGAFRVPLCVAASILGIAPRTIYNRRRKGTWPLEAIEEGGRVFFRADDVAKLFGLEKKRRGRGAPRKSERVRAAEAGLSVSEWRAQQGGQRG